MKAYLLLLMVGVLFPSTGFAQSPAGPRIVEFSGYRWIVKQSEDPMVPGPNYFSGREKDVWVDKEGKLHLRVAQQDGKWYSTAIYSEKSVGYGTYVFVLASRMDDLDSNVVLGLYTWDANTFKTDANTEIDIQFAKWANPDQKILQYTVQPTQGPEVGEGDRYRERYADFNWSPKTSKSTHVFTWTETEIRFESFKGGDRKGKPLTHWTFEGTLDGRRASQGANVSEPVQIPRPSPTTQARINLWLVDINHNSLGDAPARGKEVEVVVEKFEYIPAKD